jgi:anti-sigma factor RsiW
VSDHLDFDLIDGYALGTLDAAERQRVRDHLATCAECRQDYDEVRSVLDVMPNALPSEPPPPALLERIMARATVALAPPPVAAPTPPEPAPAPAVLPVPAPIPLPVAAQPPTLAVAPAAPAPRGRRFAPWAVGLAAALLLMAGLGDAWLGFKMRAPSHTVASVTASPESSEAPATSAPTAAPGVKAVAHAHPRPAAPKHSAPARPDHALQLRVAHLESVIAQERRAAAFRAARDRLRIAELQSALAAAPGRTVAVAPHPAASPVPVASAAASAAPQAPSPELVAALSTGRVFGIDGAIGNEPWHLTVVQPPGGANALIFSRVPHAPDGETYRTWVVRDGKTFDAGELPPNTQAKLEMPMPLRDGDVVAFTREPVGSGDRPTSAFLMQLTIKE